MERQTWKIFNPIQFSNPCSSYSLNVTNTLLTVIPCRSYQILSSNALHVVLYLHQPPLQLFQFIHQDVVHKITGGITHYLLLNVLFLPPLLPPSFKLMLTRWIHQPNYTPIFI
jgi:hypothetical protein